MTQTHNVDMQVRPSGCGCGTSASLPRPLVYVVGKLGFEFPSDARRDALTAEHAGEPIIARQQLANHLQVNPSRAASITWTLSNDEHATYVLRPSSAYAADVYQRLAKFIQDGTEWVSVPGWVDGATRLANGSTVPVIDPCLSGLTGWSLRALARPGTTQSKQLEGFLIRLLFELRNLGASPQERARNFVVTQGFLVSSLHEAIEKKLNLKDVSVAHSPLCRPGSECWDIALTFFYPDKVTTAPLSVMRFTVDVSDVRPVLIGGIYKGNSY